MTDYAWMWGGVGPHLDRLVDQMMTDIPPPPPPKPFDLAALKRLAAEVEAMRPRWDHMVVAPDVRDRMVAMTTHKREVPGPDLLWGMPVMVDEDMPPGHWELRDGDRVERRGPDGCRCELCQSGESRYDARCGACDSIVEVDHGRIEDHYMDDLPNARCPGSGEDAS